MQMDKTKIAIRERSMLEMFDLSLHVIRVYARPLFFPMLLGAVPLMLLNQLLLGWMADVEYEIGEFPFRFLWNMSLLVFIQAQAGSVFTTTFLGSAVFQERPTLGQVVSDVRKAWLQLFWCQLLLRGPILTCVLLLAIDRYDNFSPLEVLLIFIAIYSAIIRGVRPFLNEIILLERNPLRAKNPATITIGRRSAFLHSPSSSDLISRWIGSALVGILLTGIVAFTFVFLSGVVLNDWSFGPIMVQFFLPLSMWITAGYFGVVRFLNYIDLRIRHEGWEVELQLRAEAARMAGETS